MRVPASISAVLMTFMALVGSGCAAKSARGVAPVVASELNDLLRQGCYLCLEDAYQRLTATLRPNDVSTLADEVAIVIALRERELGLRDAGRLATLQARTATLSSDLRLLVDVSAAMPWSRRFAVDDDANLRRTAMSSRDVWLQALGPLARTSLVADYVRLSLVCGYAGDTPGPPVSSFGDVPLIRFRLAICQGRDVPALASVAAEVTRFVEAQYLLGLDALIAGRLDDAQSGIARAFAALPRWPAAANALAGLAFAVEDFETALMRYNEAAAVDPTHRDALLGRVKALSYLERPADAIAAADHMLALGEYFIGDAHFWRAWNLHRAAQDVEAEEAVGRAKQFMRGPEVAALSGHIAVALGKFDQARADFTAALVDAPDDCDVALALGGVEQQFIAWSAAGERFGRAADCYASREQELQESMAKLPPADSRRRASRSRDVEEAKRQQGRAALAAAVAWLRNGDREKARRFAERAQLMPNVSSEAGELLKRLTP